MKCRIAVATLLGALVIAAPALADELTATFVVEKMNCALCPVTVRKAILNVEGVIEAAVDYQSKIATVTYDDTRTDLTQIAKASTNIGYPARPQAKMHE